MKSCTFFGHRESFGLDLQKLSNTIESLIKEGVDTFYVGNQGTFDSTVYHILKQLCINYPFIKISVVLAYIPTIEQPLVDMQDAVYPPIEGHPRFAIERRNRWMIDTSDYCICYINKIWGGAYKFAKTAKQKGLTVINLGTLDSL